MRGLRRWCVGMSLLMSGWTAPVWGQSPGGSSAGLNWPPAGMSPQQAFAQPQNPGMGFPQPMAGPSHYPGGPGPVSQAQFQQPMMPPGMGPGMPPQGMPGFPGPYGPGPNLNPDPGLDMYRYGFQQTTNENGLWFSRKLNASKKYHTKVEFIVPIYAEPGDQLFGYGGLDTSIGATDGIPPYYFSVPRDPGDFAGGGGGGGGGAGGGASIISTLELERYFPHRSFSEMFGNNASNGIRLETGFETEDGSGLSINGWYGGESTNTFQRGRDPIRNYTPSIDPFSLVGNDPLFLLELNALNGSLPINSGSGVAERIPFDTLFEMQFSTEAWGAGLQILRPSIAKSSWYEIRPLIGLRYVDLRESFKFRGRDSGAEYEIVNFNDIDYAAEFETLFNLDVGFVSVTAGGAAATGDGGFEGRPVPDSFNDDLLLGNGSSVYPLTFFPTNPYETQVNASTHSRSGGPEIGLRTDIGGGDNFKIKLLGSFGLLATSQQTDLNGFGVYNHFVNRVDPDNNILTPDGGEIGTGVGGLSDEDTYFEDRSRITNVSPMVDLSVNVEFRIFEYVPILNKFAFMEDAKFTSGYGFLWLGNIARPHESVSYDSFPVNPSINPDRKGWTMQQWSFGVDWQY